MAGPGPRGGPGLLYQPSGIVPSLREAVTVIIDSIVLVKVVSIVYWNAVLILGERHGCG